jgi:inactivated superfamily I helicase
VSWDRLDELVPDHLDKYWQLMLAFLKIPRTARRQILAERGMVAAGASSYSFFR